jgi:predicted short-subunit dehydrogenase-like oxidoreductase (DUF2520 family)
MAEVQATMDDVKALADINPAFAQALTLVVMERRVDELEAEKAEAPACLCSSTPPEGNLIPG